MSLFVKNFVRRVLTPAVSVTKKSCFSTSNAVLTPKVQKPAPDFAATAVVNGEFNQLQLADFSGKYVVLMFYPLDFTFVCPTELIAYSEKAKEFAGIDCQVIGVSTDSEFSHLAWINTPRKDGGLGKIDIPLLADYSKKISRDYDVLLDAGFALRGLFIIDRNGILRHMSVNDLPVGRSVDETLRLVKAFQFADKHGEVCPANWNPDTNADTIKPNPRESKEYFQKAN
ncbi:peroxiredoxin-2-like [Pararge aegeria]|uniref:thioredoxin-dependent peroxiredoxin n=2 Tax=Pararge aegeria TaxID=116150 RepID=A0A8S4SCZ9_9NEOP|nr:peroxiredoxin-2-like [Pararge aegeria]XP_039760511.1 peroxiredoxin-2-like [Pararge aegeria]CAH2248839.1 jg7548 [Pararge aegeria aegeria]